MEVFFWFSVFMILYAYFGYPLCLVSILVFNKIAEIITPRDSTLNPGNNALSKKSDVSFIITAYNEQKRIQQKLENTLSQDYPIDNLEIIVASDCSNDETDQIVKSFQKKGVILVSAPERKGKENAQKLAVDKSKGEILVFSDVATILKPDGISKIVRNFKDPLIGCVSSEDRFIEKDGKISGEGAYVKYEMFLRKLESKVNSLVGLSGSFFAARREVCNNWAVDLQSDFNTLLNSIKMGLKGVSDPKSIGYYRNISNESKEFNRKVRTVLRGITVFINNLYLLNPKHYGIFSWQLFSHKLCRWLVPFFMITAMLTNSFLIFDSFLMVFMLIVQLSLYGMAFYGKRFVRKERTNSFTNNKQKTANYSKLGGYFNLASRFLYFIVAVNYSILFAWIRYFKGERATYWEPSKR